MNAKKLNCLITAGPTREYLDPVRFFSNASSGKMGYALAAAARARGFAVTLVSGPVCLVPPAGVSFYPSQSARDMELACLQLFPLCDLLIMCAAVADYRPVRVRNKKMKKRRQAFSIELEPTPDILKGLATKKKGQICVGFAAETEQVAWYARKKLREKNLDWVVANEIGRRDSGIESDMNRVSIFSARDDEERGFGPALKEDVAEFILDTVVPGGNFGK